MGKDDSEIQKGSIHSPGAGLRGFSAYAVFLVSVCAVGLGIELCRSWALALCRSWWSWNYVMSVSSSVTICCMTFCVFSTVAAAVSAVQRSFLLPRDQGRPLAAILAAALLWVIVYIGLALWLSVYAGSAPL